MLLVQVQLFGTGIRHGLEVLHKCCRKVETISQKIWGSNPYVCRNYSGKTDRGPFCWGAEFIQNFGEIYGEIYLIGENFVGKKFSLGKIFVTYISSLFPDEKFFLRYNEYI